MGLHDKIDQLFFHINDFARNGALQPFIDLFVFLRYSKDRLFTGISGNHNFASQFAVYLQGDGYFFLGNKYRIIRGPGLQRDTWCITNMLLQFFGKMWRKRGQQNQKCFC